jgi:uncharacterized protein with ParB-like and HNH nuclease domain
MADKLDSKSKYWENEEESDLDFEKIPSEISDEEKDTAKYKITTYGTDFTLEILSNKMREGVEDVEKEILVPIFQRRYLWPPSKASKLIESFLLGLPVPQIFLFRDTDQSLIVVDGQQRLKSIHYFFKEEFEDGTPFFLRGVKDQWEGKKFSDLSSVDKRRLKNSVLRATVFEQLEPQDDKSSMFEIFLRLNTGGVSLSYQEVRNCVLQGELTIFLDSLNMNSQWRSIINKESPDSRMKDVEMILRFFALYTDSKRYIKPMKDFLDIWMTSHRNISSEEQDTLSEKFINVVNFVSESLGKKAFRLGGGINVAIFDSVCMAIADKNLELNEDMIKKFREQYFKLLENEEYRNLLRGGTTDEGNVSKRIEIAKEYLLVE